MSRRTPLALTIATFAIAFLVPAWPWLSGAVTVPYDAKSTFLPPVEFMARAFATGDSPFWTPNVFAGWPNVADPQSMLASPLHVVLALVSGAPGFRAIDGVTFAYLFIGGVAIILYFADRGWHSAGALVAALAFAFGGAASARLQHTGQVISLAYLPLALLFLSRALDRSSWRWGAAAGAAAALIVLGRDQVALLEVYLLAGYVLAHLVGPGCRARLRAGIAPLLAGGVAGLAIIIVPVTLTELLALRSNRPEFSFIEAGRGSLHWTHLLSLVFPDLFGAMDPKVDFWGAGGFAWNERFGMADLFLAQNMGLLYSGVIAPVLLVAGATRGWLWSREVRFFTVAALLIAFYMFGWYTPVFHMMYEVMPGVKLFRRPADATFVFGALVAMLAGYLLHRWLTDASEVSRPRNLIALGFAIFVLAFTIWLSATTVGLSIAMKPIVVGSILVVGAIVVLCVARRVAPMAAMALLAIFTTADLAWNNAPHESTGLPPAIYDALRQDTQNDTVALIKQRLANQEPNHRDRVELIGVGYHWPNICLVHGCEHVFGHNPLRLKEFFEATKVGDTVAAPGQRPFSALYPSYRSAFADLFGLRLIATGVPVEQIDKSLKLGDLNVIAHTKDAYVYENPRALPRVMLLGDWKVADFATLIANGWPADVDPRRTVLLEKSPPAPVLSSFEAPGRARLVRYANTEVVIEVDSPSGAVLLLNDVWHPWWCASIDGLETEIFRANVLFRAVQVPPGKFTVRFSFEPMRGAWAELRARLRGATVP